MSATATPYWLLDLQIDGRTYRWSSPTGVVIDDGTEYQPGLSDLTSALGATGQSLVVTDPSVDWPNLATEIDGGTALLRRWVEGFDPVPYVAGEARLTSYGTRQDPIEVSIVRRIGPTLGSRMPDALAHVSSDTWPIAGSTLGDDGRPYPIVFGYPGYDAEASTWTPVVPIPLAQWNASEANTFAIVHEDGSQAITSVRVLNQETGGQKTETTTATRDNLGRLVRYLFFSAGSPAYPAAATDTRDLYAAYAPTLGGGGPRDAYSVLTYILKRWGQSSADWSRLPAIADRLSAYQVDTWIDDGQSSPWEWFQSAILPDLPFEVRSSERGLYLVERRWIGDGTRLVGDLDVDNGEAVIDGVCTLADTGPINEFVARFRPGREDDWLEQIVVTGDRGLVSAELSGADTRTLTVRSGLCSASLARYGFRPLDQPIDLGWTWDRSTAQLVLQRRAERDCFPARLVTYRLGREGADLIEGDEVTLTDTDRGFAGIRALVDGPPEVGSAVVRVQLRIPRAA